MQIVLNQFSGLLSIEAIQGLPRQILDWDWSQDEVLPGVEFVFALDDEFLWFGAAREASAIIHPESRRGKWQAELWKYDVAEFFLLDETTGIYREFNLSPNGGWWSDDFEAPRKSRNLAPIEGVEAWAQYLPNSWACAARIPLKVFGGKLPENMRLAATFILNTPQQIFLTTARIPKGIEPDFHRPVDFEGIKIKKI